MADQSAPMPEPCIHSNGPLNNPECVSCWQGQAERCEAENQRLRAIILDSGNAGVKRRLVAHDRYWRGSTLHA